MRAEVLRDHLSPRGCADNRAFLDEPTGDIGPTFEVIRGKEPSGTPSRSDSSATALRYGNFSTVFPPSVSEPFNSAKKSLSSALSLAWVPGVDTGKNKPKAIAPGVMFAPA